MNQTRVRIKCNHNSYVITDRYVGKPFHDVECQMCMAIGRVYDKNGQIKWKDDQYVEKLYAPQVNKSLVGKTFQRLGIRK